MEKKRDGMKCQLKKRYKEACNGYLMELLRMWELDAHYGYWVGDEEGTVYCYGDTHTLTMENIIYIVENDIEEVEVLVWEDYLCDAQEFGFDTPNLKAWHKGCPRVEPAVFDRLHSIKKDLADAVEEEKERCKKGEGERMGY